jgi:cytidylate kinase
MNPAEIKHSGHPLNIAIDGPAGAGKSTIAKRVAEALGAIYIDTGAMYRACALKAIRSGIPMSDTGGIARMMEETAVEFRASDGIQRVFLDGADVTGFIRSPEVTKGSSDIARIAEVRHRLVALQRAIARTRDVVMDGRDIGTHVLPDAEFKFFLTATDKVRAMRRLQEGIDKGNTGKPGDCAPTYDEVLADIRYRDIQDSTRAISPLIRAADAMEIDTSDMGIEQVVEVLLSRIHRDTHAGGDRSGPREV